MAPPCSTASPPNAWSGSAAGLDPAHNAYNAGVIKNSTEKHKN